MLLDAATCAYGRLTAAVPAGIGLDPDGSVCTEALQAANHRGEQGPDHRGRVVDRPCAHLRPAAADGRQGTAGAVARRTDSAASRQTADHGHRR